jgi:hypothetical protein
MAVTHSIGRRRRWHVTDRMAHKHAVTWLNEEAIVDLALIYRIGPTANFGTDNPY